MKRGRRQAEAIGAEPWPLQAWPNVPVRFLLCRDDHLFPAKWPRGVVRDRLGIGPTRSTAAIAPALARSEGAGRSPGGIPNRDQFVKFAAIVPRRRAMARLWGLACV
jgi:hypothetical protein